MAIPVWTNSNVTVNCVVSMTSLSVSGYNYSDDSEPVSVTATPFTANSGIASNPYNVFSPGTVVNANLSVTAYNYSDDYEAASITKTPFTVFVPYAISSITSGGYSGQDIIISEYVDEYWTTG